MFTYFLTSVVIIMKVSLTPTIQKMKNDFVTIIKYFIDRKLYQCCYYFLLCRTNMMTFFSSDILYRKKQLYHIIRFDHYILELLHQPVFCSRLRNPLTVCLMRATRKLSFQVSSHTNKRTSEG